MYEVKLFNPNGSYNSSQFYRRKYLAVCSGETWKELAQGNKYKVARVES